MSYLEIKRIVEKEIEKVTKPLFIDDEVRRVMAKHHISEETVQQALNKTNAHLKRVVRHKLSKQVVHQLVQQIVKNESQKLMKVNEQLQRVSQLVQPIIVPESKGGLSAQERVTQLQELVEVLPEPEYLFAFDRGDEDKEEEEEQDARKYEERKEDKLGDGNDEENLGNRLIVDNEARVESISKRQLEEEYAKAVSEEIKEDVALRRASNEELRQKYAELRTQLIEVSGKLIYERQKIEYLTKLEEKTRVIKNIPRKDEGRTDLDAQITRFRILVEKLEYATS
ncbi:hypothetical protein ACI3LY_003059 [Candidozyma auris]|uniref:Uncharacterized protein n=2 Tax=Candidozyma auris TaxID=498019 RepID=A0AB36W812_CANAR|nr:hypothetical protein QG37_00962 [[Candida] auris]PIS52146.1 hypothetical protein B9J08_003757 [[Candida] auris]PIS54133.1 hypothetical protein CJI97_003831 [[Candida] auris]QWW21555.1 hypothetical protein CA7LBN_000301 [[Candida] auris]